MKAKVTPKYKSRGRCASLSLGFPNPAGNTHTHSETRTECHPWVSPPPADTSSGIHLRKAFQEPLKTLVLLTPVTPLTVLYLGSRQGRPEGLGNAHPLGAAQ